MNPRSRSPARLVLSGIATALFGLFPGCPGELGGAGGVRVTGAVRPADALSQWLLHLSPFSHIPMVPGGDIAALPLASLLAATAVLVAEGSA